MRTTLLYLLPIIAAASVLSSCSLFQRDMTRTEEYRFGRVQFLDNPTSRRLRVVEQEAGRDSQGRLEVTITWENTTDDPYRSRIRRIFIDEQGLRERGAYEWNVHEFPPGQSTLTWKSYSVSAVHYRIEVHKD